MASARKTKQVKVKKKRWFPILSPKSLGEKFIGETYLGESKEAVGRTIRANLMQVTGDIKSQSSSITFTISGAQDNKLNTEILGYEFSASSIKRFIRRKMTRVDDSLALTTKENIKVRIKPFLLTRSKVSRSVENAIRTQLKEELTKAVNKTPYEELIHNILKHRMQKELKDVLSKIYPIKSLEIRVLKRIGEEVQPLKVKQEPVETKEEEKKEEKPEKVVKKEEKPKEVKKVEKKTQTKKKPKKEAKKTEKKAKK